MLDTNSDGLLSHTEVKEVPNDVSTKFQAEGIQMGKRIVDCYPCNSTKE